MVDMGQIRGGMRVVDAGGEDVGTVEDIKAGDPEAVSAQGQAAGGPGLMGDLSAAFVGAEPDLPTELAERMLRVGYIKIDGKGLFAKDLYAAADRIDRVEGNTVHLGVSRDQLVPE